MNQEINTIHVPPENKLQECLRNNLNFTIIDKNISIKSLEGSRKVDIDVNENLKIIKNETMSKNTVIVEAITTKNEYDSKGEDGKQYHRTSMSMSKNNSIKSSIS